MVPTLIQDGTLICCDAEGALRGPDSALSPGWAQLTFLPAHPQVVGWSAAADRAHQEPGMHRFLPVENFGIV